jgi:uncharacterized protein (TIGR03067 family)
MRVLCYSTLVFVCAAAARGDDPPRATDDGRKMQGTWKPATAELAGKPFPDDVLKTMKLILADGKYTVMVGERPDEGAMKLDSSKSPRAMDIVGTKGPNQGKSIPAIYELNGSTLKICYDLSGKSRPKEFKTLPGSQLFLVEYKRQPDSNSR